MNKFIQNRETIRQYMDSFAAYISHDNEEASSDVRMAAVSISNALYALEQRLERIEQAISDLYSTKGNRL